MTKLDEVLKTFGPFVYARVGQVAVLSCMGFDVWARVGTTYALFGWVVPLVSESA